MGTKIFRKIRNIYELQRFIQLNSPFWGELFTFAFGGHESHWSHLQKIGVQELPLERSPQGCRMVEGLKGAERPSL